MDRISSMAVFAKAVELGSFSAAGEALKMSSQLVGKHVQALEIHLGARLLNRSTRRQHLTDIGATYYERVKTILAEVESAESLVAETHRQPRGRLRISAPSTFGVYALSEALPAYMARYPEISVELSFSNRYVDLIHEGFDAAFRVGELADSTLVGRFLTPYRLILCASPQYLAEHVPIREPLDLRHHECLRLMHPQLSTYWTFKGPNGDVVVPVSGRLIADSGAALLAAARASAGLILQPEEMVKRDLDTGCLVEVLKDFPSEERSLHLLYPKDRQMTPKMRTFVDFVLETFERPARAEALRAIDVSGGR